MALWSARRDVSWAWRSETAVVEDLGEREMRAEIIDLMDDAWSWRWFSNSGVWLKRREVGNDEISFSSVFSSSFCCCSSSFTRSSTLISSMSCIKEKRKGRDCQ